jgi:6-pyruvoyl-tetrahydropterin synthase
MMFLVLLYLIYNQKKTSNLFLHNSNTLRNKVVSEKYNGYDHRNLNDMNKTSQVTLYKIQQHFEKKKILDLLQDTNISLTTKILLLQDSSIKPSNLYGGGLMKDFDFEF